MQTIAPLWLWATFVGIVLVSLLPLCSKRGQLFFLMFTQDRPPAGFRGLVRGQGGHAVIC